MNNAERYLQSVRPGDRVRFSTPQDQRRTGRVVFAWTPEKPWLVLDAGGRYGQPAVVNEGNVLPPDSWDQTLNQLAERLGPFLREEQA